MEKIVTELERTYESYNSGDSSHAWGNGFYGSAPYSLRRGTVGGLPAITLEVFYVENRDQVPSIGGEERANSFAGKYQIRDRDFKTDEEAKREFDRYVSLLKNNERHIKICRETGTATIEFSGPGW